MQDIAGDPRSATALFDLICGNDLDAFDSLPRRWFALLAVAAEGGFDIAQLSEHVVPFNDLAECGVLVVEEGRVTEANEKLTPGRVGIL